MLRPLTPVHVEPKGWGKRIRIANNSEAHEDAQLFVFSTVHFGTGSYRLAKGD
jgi:hypothetical protein